MLNILINAYAISPNWGSEQGMGWNWVINIAKYCRVDVITEGEWKDEIDKALLSLLQAGNITFHYLPIDDNVRRMCWNQGDWRFYWHYAKWQRRALKKAVEIIAEKKIDVIHQLNMIGFREPGYLWQIKDIPFLWGPVGGMELMPLSYLKDAPLKQRMFNRIKNALNAMQYSYSPRVRKAIKRSDAIISAVRGVQNVLQNRYHKSSILINETGSSDGHSFIKRFSAPEEPLKVIWVGKFDFRKQLPLAIRSVAATKCSNIELHICGTGSHKIVREMMDIAEKCGIQQQCHWHGNVNHNRILGMMVDADILYFTSIMEATSTVVLEAISVGLPVLCFNTCGFGPIVKSFAGLTIELSTPNQSVNDFSNALLKIYKDKSILDEISRNIIRQRDSLTWEYKARRTVEIYRQIIN